MKSILHILFCFLCISLFSVNAFADEVVKAANDPVIMQESSSDGKTEERVKEREKTINDINTFLIESYKLKIDRILGELNTSIVQATRNNPQAQVQLLKKIQNDITAKEGLLQSKSVSQNRKKILGEVFSYIQKNIDDTIRKISTERAEK